MKTNFKIASYRKYEITFSCTWQNGNTSTDTVIKIGIRNAMKARQALLELGERLLNDGFIDSCKVDMKVGETLCY